MNSASLGVEVSVEVSVSTGLGAHTADMKTHGSKH